MLYDYEYPEVHTSGDVDLSILSRPIRWFKPFYTGLGQMLLYRFRVKPNESKYAEELLSKKIIKMNDGSEIMIGMTTPKSPKAVVLYLHTVCGNYSQLSHIAHMTQDDNIAYFSYTRSGCDPLLAFSKFNFVGRTDELELVIEYINHLYPNVPIHAVAASAGSNLLIRYLSAHNDKKKVKSAVMLSPGYHFIEACDHMSGITRAYLVNKMKYTLRNLTGPNRDKLNAVRTMDDWVEFQSHLLGYETRNDFLKDCEPINHMTKINVPSLFISSYDDSVFCGSLTKKYLYLPKVNPNITIVTTNRGGHVIFEDEDGIYPWCLRVAYDWIKKHL